MENQLINNTIFSNDDYLFFKIMSNNIEPLTGEILNLSNDSITRLKQILNKYCGMDENYKNINELVVNDYINGLDLDQLKDKYHVPKKELRLILKQTGYEKIRNTYNSTQKLKLHNEKYSNAGQRYTNEEDKQIEMDYMNGYTLNELALKNKRTRGAIIARLKYLGFAMAEEIVEKQWPYCNKKAKIIDINNSSSIIDNKDLDNRIQYYLERRKMDANEVNYRKAKEKILLARFNIRCENI